MNVPTRISIIVTLMLHVQTQMEVINVLVTLDIQETGRLAKVLNRITYNILLATYDKNCEVRTRIYNYFKGPYDSFSSKI